MALLAHQFATAMFNLNGKALKLPEESMKHIHYVYNSKNRDVILKFGRQTHKSTTLGYRIAMPCIRYPNYHCLYVAPTQNQISVFSTDKLDSSLKGSDVVKDHYFDTKTKDQISYKELRNNSKIYLRSAFHSADAIRGISADGLCVDEVQDMVSDHLPVISQCMGHSLAKYKDLKTDSPYLPAHLFRSTLYAGTPKTIDNTMEQLWDESTQSEWIIKCQHQGCKKYNYINEYNIGDTCLICNKCGKPIYYKHGQLVSMCPDNFILGIRMPQIVLNWVNDVTDSEVWQAQIINYRKTSSAERFYNEVLALPYAAAKHPLNAHHIKACCDNDFINYSEEENKIGNDKRFVNCDMYAGIDWGKGDTKKGTSYSILYIGCMYKGKFRTTFVRKYVGRMSEPLIQIKDMLGIISKFKCKFVIADTGDGRTSNAMMVEALGTGRFAELYEHGSMKKKIKWDGESGHYIINRTRVMTDLIMEIQREQVTFFTYEKFKEFQSDFTSIYTEYSESTRMQKYDHNAPDDTFHAHMFCRIACKISRNEYEKYLVNK